MADKKLVILCLISVCSAVYANTEQREDVNSIFLLGPAVVITDKPYRGIDSSVYPIPLVKFVRGRFYISGATAGYRLLADDGWNFDVIGKWRFDGYDADNSDRLDGMHDRRQTIDAGGEFTLTGNWGQMWVSVITDILGQHDGQEIRVGYGKSFVFQKLALIPSGGVIWQSNNLANYYYGVRSDEAVVGRPEYQIGDSTNWFVGLRAEYRPDDRWTLTAGLTYQFLDSKIRRSPIIDDDYVISFLAGAMYKF